jgi:hypothetical protein
MPTEKWNVTKQYKPILDRCGVCGHSIKVYKLLTRSGGCRNILIKCGDKECQNEMKIASQNLVEIMVGWNMKQRNKPS